MLFYAVGELFQTAAVNRAKKSIKALLDIRPDTVSVMRNGALKVVSPIDVKIGEFIQVKAGEKVALDGELISESASFNTAALTGESKPDTKREGEKVLAGMINLATVSDIKVTALFKDSKLSKILEMVQDATARKSPTQLFISKLFLTGINLRLIGGIFDKLIYWLKPQLTNLLALLNTKADKSYLESLNIVPS